MPPPRLRLPQLFDVALNATVKRYWTLVATVLVVAIPARAVEVAILTATVSDPEDITSRSAFGSQAGASTNGAAGVNVTAGVLGALVTVVGTALCFKVAATAYAGARTGGRSSLAFAAPRIGAVIWGALIAALGVLGGLVALILPGIWLLVAWSVFVPALLFEELGPVQALRRSFDLVRGRWWSTCAALVIVALISGFASGIVSLGFDGLMSTSLGDRVFGAALIDAAGGAVASAVALPIQAVMVAVLYFDLRRRKERLEAAAVARRLDIEAVLVEAPEAAPVLEPTSPGETGESGEEWEDWEPPAPPPDAEPPSDWAPPRPPG